MTVLPFVLRSLDHYHLGVERGFDAERVTSTHWCLTESGRWFLVEEDRHGCYYEIRRLTPAEQRIAETYRPAPADHRCSRDLAIVRGDLLPTDDVDPTEVLGAAPCVVVSFDAPRRRSSSPPPPRLVAVSTKTPAPVAPALPAADASTTAECSSSALRGACDVTDPRDSGGRAHLSVLKLIIEGGA